MPTGIYKRKPFSEEHKRKLRENHKGMLGKRFSEEHKKKIGEVSKKRWQNPEYRRRLSEVHKGKHHSENTKTKMRENHKGMLGLRLSEETRRKLSEINKGEKCNFWKGGITSENAIIRTNVEFRLWREAVFARDNWTCQKCFKKGCYLHSHHIQNFAQFPEQRFAINNGITFCRDCHLEFHKIYGRKNNTKEQLGEFLYKIKIIWQHQKHIILEDQMGR